jgi:hypothetical protein
MDNADETALPREVGQETRVAAQQLAFEFYTGFLAQKKAEFSLKTKFLEQARKRRFSCLPSCTECERTADDCAHEQAAAR